MNLSVIGNLGIVIAFSGAIATAVYATLAYKRQVRSQEETFHVTFSHASFGQGNRFLGAISHDEETEKRDQGATDLFAAHAILRDRILPLRQRQFELQELRDQQIITMSDYMIRAQELKEELAKAEMELVEIDKRINLPAAAHYSE